MSVRADRSRAVCRQAEVRPPSMATLEERALVDRCLQGEPGAWDELYYCYHEPLKAAIRMMFAPRQWDPNLIEEVVARVWYAVVADNGKLLDQFDAHRGGRLITYLAVIARGQAAGLFRTERRRRDRESLVCRFRQQVELSGQVAEDFNFEEFRATLTNREREFFDCELVPSRRDEGVASFSAANRWQLRSRIHSKLMRYLGEH